MVLLETLEVFCPAEREKKKKTPQKLTECKPTTVECLSHRSAFCASGRHRDCGGLSKAWKQEQEQLVPVELYMRVECKSDLRLEERTRSRFRTFKNSSGTQV